MTFQVGDQVVYPSQGAGVVDEKTTREVLGETHEEVGLRHTIGADEIDQIKDALIKADLSLPNQWPPRYRAEQDILAGGSAYELARLIGVLAQRDVEKGLAATEREVLENAKSMLASELAVVQGKTLDEAARDLNGLIADKIG